MTTSTNYPRKLKNKIIYLFFGSVVGMMLIVLATVSIVLIIELRSEQKKPFQTKPTMLQKEWNCDWIISRKMLSILAKVILSSMGLYIPEIEMYILIKW
ncbi:MAG: hypothetical protein OMM_08332 [Candidatus Magnetoglobus multicellularis str. Araruama]|uniref:Uncharacterized protein n=1 Tax=Candidatus Magnetoglobus multicellularis str. Araruama TaxID=890399 RepID=A0A1V1P876_9BACT|nr:MAG: hypothetical protein OMM_08332 [Candidatus Magnetoglobus multicellularis str. Araruama]